jgi:hypothetical protein
MPTMTTRDMITVSKMGPTIVVGLPKLRVPRQHLPVGSMPPRANKARDKVTQRMISSWHYPRLHRRDPTSSSFVFETWSGGFHHAPPLCGLAPCHPGSPDRDYLGMMHETTKLGFARGGGHQPLSSPMGWHLPMMALTYLR